MTNDQRFFMDAATVEEIAAKMDALPPVEKQDQRLSKREIVKKLAPAIERMRERGYDLEAIAKFIADETGSEIAPGTLRVYLSAKRHETSPKRSSATKKKRPVLTTAKQSVTGDATAPVMTGVTPLVPAPEAVVEAVRETLSVTVVATQTATSDVTTPVNEVVKPSAKPPAKAGVTPPAKNDAAPEKHDQKKSDVLSGKGLFTPRPDTRDI